jgi:hypothetical protein
LEDSVTGTEGAQKTPRGAEDAANARTSSGERPATTPPEAHDTEPPAGPTPSFRARQHTLIGVAPAAPIVSGRPQSPSQPFGEGVEETGDVASSAAQAPPVSELRPRHDHAEDTLSQIDAAPPGPKHTLDAISIAEAPTQIKKRSRTTATTVALTAVIALVVCALVGWRVARRIDIPAPRAAPPSEVVTSSIAPPADPAPVVTASASPSAPSSSAAAPADDLLPKAAPPKPKHPKGSPRKARATPPSRL